MKMPTDELWNTLVSESVPDYVTAVILRDFLAERFFVVSILVSTRGLFRKCCPTSSPKGFVDTNVFKADSSERFHREEACDSDSADSLVEWNGFRLNGYFRLGSEIIVRRLPTGGNCPVVYMFAHPFSFHTVLGFGCIKHPCGLNTLHIFKGLLLFSDCE
jgi:hypothetical protein